MPRLLAAKKRPRIVEAGRREKNIYGRRAAWLMPRGPWVKIFDDGCICFRLMAFKISGRQPYCGAACIPGSVYILQNEDKSYCLRDPWMDEVLIVGTTDVEYKGDPKAED